MKTSLAQKYFCPLRLLGVFFLFAIFAGCVLTDDREGLALYIVAGVDDPRLVDELGLEVLSLEDSPLIDESDIVSYDLSTHTMQLTPEAFAMINEQFTLPVDVDGIPFVVTVGGERIYAGAFYTPASSLSYEGVVILHPMGETHNEIVLSMGYPGPDFSSGPDLRGDPRIVERINIINQSR